MTPQEAINNAVNDGIDALHERAVGRFTRLYPEQAAVLPGPRLVELALWDAVPGPYSPEWDAMMEVHYESVRQAKAKEARDEREWSRCLNGGWGGTPNPSAVGCEGVSTRRREGRDTVYCVPKDVARNVPRRAVA